MPIIVYNSKSKRKEPFVPIEENRVKMYVCGITAYDYCHIGHARSALVFDMIYRYLQYSGYRVTFIRNFTDIDDKIINRAKEENTTCQELSQRFIKKFHEDMTALGTTPPSAEPLATEHLPEMIGLIEELVEKGLAYPAGGDVYFRVRKFPDYGCLSGRGLDDMMAGARVEPNSNKEDPMDFVLWKGSKPGEPTWESPWGAGRPGWHIECSAMGRKYLGDTFDIHGGGKDLIFPHHENEIAQSECANGKPFANYWIHNGFVTVKEEKMSKSLGNFLTIREVLASYPAEVLRLWVFSTHYRNPLEYSESVMNDAESGLTRLYRALEAIEDLPIESSPDAASVISDKDRRALQGLGDDFAKAMDQDFNSAMALGRVFDITKILNKLCQSLPKLPAEADLELLCKSAAKMRGLLAVLGLLRQEPKKFLSERRERRLKSLGLEPSQIEQLVQERLKARERKDWQEADRIRNQLQEMGVELMDNKTGGDGWDV